MTNANTMNDFSTLLHDNDFRCALGDYEIALNEDNYNVSNDIRDYVFATFNYDLNF